MNAFCVSKISYFSQRTIEFKLFTTWCMNKKRTSKTANKPRQTRIRKKKDINGHSTRKIVF